MSFEELAELARAMRAAGASVESALLAMRSEGASQGTSVRVLREVEDRGLGELKETVDSSDTWSDRRASNTWLRERLLEAFEELEAGGQTSYG